MKLRNAIISKKSWNNEFCQWLNGWLSVSAICLKEFYKVPRLLEIEQRRLFFIHAFACVASWTLSFNFTNNHKLMKYLPSD